MPISRGPAKRPATAIVIGNGLVGLCTAIDLQQRGVVTRLVAPDVPWRGASWGNAGHIAVEQIEPHASLAALGSMPRRLFALGGPVAFPPGDIRSWFPFSLRLLRASTPTRFHRGTAALRSTLATAVPAWKRLLNAAGARALLRLDGHFIVWERESTARRGMAHWLGADTGTASTRPATTMEMAALQSLTSSNLAGAARVEGSGQIADMTTLGSRLHEHFQRCGGNRVAGRVTRIAPDADGGRAALDTGETLSADIIVVAAGAASRDLLATLGLDAPLIAERGYHIQSDAADWPADLPPVVFEDRSMIVTRFASSIRAASFVEFSTIDSPPDPRKWIMLRNHVARLGLPFNTPISEWVGARPTLPDYLPAIGRDIARPWLAYAFGHQHLGVTLAATTGEAIGALLCGDAPSFDFDPFSLARFGR
ncbi:NAD(P)/FAD-dependent oxidoreductase [Hephaestia mangrovi]|uniref:NAD(P)/FAD-dependent oxidoreductase n=1 Tax=Hephaestia mangrovi TaxID=2873268 RepID=UPI001CA6B1D4|nr:FAD-binding oxidoreductase [Hephaestia mangrovi]MBY8827631.1 FAD-binding oxidoreductase [Hephaestia mangrovi]